MVALSILAWVKWDKFFTKYQFEKAPALEGTYISDDFPSQEVFQIPKGARVATFYALGDAGTGNEVQYAVGSAMNTAAETDKPSCVLLLGDNFYPEGVTSTSDPLWESCFEKPYAGKNLQIPFFACLGNHDHHGSTQAQIDRTAQNTRWRMPAANYRCFPDPDKKDLVGVFSLDTEPLHGRSRGYRKNVEKLDELLAQSQSRWKIVMGHHPMQSGGRPAYNHHRIKDKIYETLVKHDVDFYLSGHDHIMEMGSVDDTIPYAVLGSGGTDEGSGRKSTKIPNMYFSSATAGFGRIRVFEDRLLIDFIDHEQNVLYSRAVFKN